MGAQRRGKDAYFRESHHSPIPPAERHAFAGLDYYPVDESLRFAPIALGPLPGGVRSSTQVQTSDAALRDAIIVGTFDFDVEGSPQRLMALRLAGPHDDALFVPFRDATSGSETYEAGRYLDLTPLGDEGYDLDFNLAYAPFCAYSSSYSCPLPPRENWLTVAIRAGERGA